MTGTPRQDISRDFLNANDQAYTSVLFHYKIKWSYLLDACAIGPEWVSAANNYFGNITCKIIN